MNNAVANNQLVNTEQFGWLVNWAMSPSCHHKPRHMLSLPLNFRSSQHYIYALSLIHRQIGTLVFVSFDGCAAHKAEK